MVLDKRRCCQKTYTTHTHTHTADLSLHISADEKSSYYALALILFLSQGLFNPHESPAHTHTNKLFQFLPLNQALSAALQPDMRLGTEEMNDVNQCYNSAEPTT